MKWHILENNLSEQLGHFLNSTLGIKREAELRSIEVQVYTHVEATQDILDRVHGRPLFRHRSWDGDKRPDAINAMEEARRRVRAILRRPGRASPR